MKTIRGLEMKTKPRDLEECCNQYNFSTELKGNIYCSLGLNKKVDCLYQSKEQDENGIRPCNNPMYQKDNNLFNWKK